MSDSSRTDYRSINKNVKPFYKYKKITQQTGSGIATCTNAGGDESIFELPIQAYNFSKSMLNFTATPPLTLNSNNYIHADNLCFIRQIQLVNREDVVLCNLNHVANYTSVVWGPETPLDEFLTYPVHSNDDGYGKNFMKCNVSNETSVNVTERAIADAVSASGAAHVSAAVNADGAHTTQVELRAAVDAVNASIDTAVNNAVNTAVDALRDGVKTFIKPPSTAARRAYDGTNATTGVGGDYVNCAYTEPKYFHNGSAQGEADPVVKVRIDFGMIYNTILAMDKDFIFNEVLLLKIIWNSAGRVYYSSDGGVGNDIISPGAGPAHAAAVYTLAAGDTNVGISDLKLYMAIEQNSDIVNALKAKTASGFQMAIPFVHSYRTNLQTTNQNVSLRFNRGHGRKLKKIYHSLFHNTESKNTAYDHDNRRLANLGQSQHKLDTYHTELNQELLQPFEVSCENEEDYMLYKDKLEGSVIQNVNIYQYKHFILDDFTECHSCKERNNDKEQHNISDGIPLELEQKWDFIGVIPAGTVQAAGAPGAKPLNHYSFAIVEKVLKIGPLGVIEVK